MSETFQEAYKRHHAGAVARGLKEDAAHEIGLYAAYLCGVAKSRNMRNLLERAARALVPIADHEYRAATRRDIQNFLSAPPRETPASQEESR